MIVKGGMSVEVNSESCCRGDLRMKWIHVSIHLLIHLSILSTQDVGVESLILRMNNNIRY